MKRALLWFGVLLLLPLLQILITGGGRPSESGQALQFFFGLASLLWICVGVAWGARGVVRYLKR